MRLFLIIYLLTLLCQEIRCAENHDSIYLQQIIAAQKTIDDNDFSFYKSEIERIEKSSLSKKLYEVNFVCLLRLSVINTWEKNILGLDSVQLILSRRVKFLSKDSDYLFLYYNNSCVYFRGFDINKSIEYGLKAINCEPKRKRYKELKPLAFEALGMSYYLKGDVFRSMRYAEKSYRELSIIFGESDFRLSYPLYLKSLCAQENGYNDKAIDYLVKAIKLVQKSNLKVKANDEKIRYQIKLVELFLTGGHKERGRELLNKLVFEKESLNNRRKGQIHYLNALLLSKETVLDEDKIIREIDLALKFYEDAVVGQDNFLILECLELVSSFYLKIKNLDKAAYTYEQLLSRSLLKDKNSLNSNYNIITLEALLNLIIISGMQNDLKSLRKHLELSLEILRNFRFDICDNSVRKYWAEKQNLFLENLIMPCAKFGLENQLYEILEMNKSLLLEYDLSFDNNFQKKSKVARIKELINIIEKNKTNKEIDPRFIEIFKDSLDSNIQRLDLLNKSKVEFSLKQSYSLNSLKNDLEDNQCLIEFFNGNEFLYFIIVSKYGIEFGQIKFNEFEVSSSLLELNSESSKAKIDSQIFLSLYRKVFSRLEQNITNLIIIPDDFLNNFPFELLKTEDGQYLGDKYDIHYQYSAKLWKLLKDKPSTKKDLDFLGFAYNKGSEKYLAERSCDDIGEYDLLCSESEVNSIRNILGEHNTDITSDSIHLIFEEASNAKILHLATHSCLDEDMEHSILYFNNESINSDEIQLQDIGADHVVLSACETGYGQIIKGEGSMSLAKGFFHAGCKSALVSLWPVDDCTTSELMQYYYKGLKEGKTKSLALKDAKWEYRQNAHHSRRDPYYWAGFILIGDNAPLFETGNPWILYTSLIFLSIMCLLLVYNKMNR